ncbi:rhomboid family intramembrane serine protease [Paenibacillus hunanensis]|uniref:Membrane associated rhomboid family serine protease n=1 Tax=Paenibacillus hunanensis TaxID=539262 RepID=A0ABU1J175_9BACL|nr:rhomboid family intramembrane serine protease [Paenibacillus hunanensis]MCL9663069.1 rhomboid family intramembrane serine protease [Paenibacillus hunanensis]MDR6245233.1 membrane associated rhomboid family serine protease [Paenibacillus hunanensis]GGJ20343.1 putative rhomboid protease YdcA [Paenibacillus hunanensis]
MLFVRYENWKSFLRFYPLTSLIALANIVVFLLMTFNGGSQNSATLVEYGALTNLIGYDQWWRTFTAMFVHIGFDHLLFNTFAIIVFAPPLERLLGTLRYGVLYFASGLIGNIISLELYRQSSEGHLAAGASGAIYGIYGAFLYIALFQRGMLDRVSRQTIYTILGLGLVYTFIMPGIGIWAHLGGLISGFFIYGLLLRLTGLERRWQRIYQRYEQAMKEQQMREQQMREEQERNDPKL